MKYITENPKDIEILAKKFLENIKVNKNKSTIITLSGDLGAGKTTFVQNIGKILGIKNKIVSPTFVLMKRYSLKENQFKNLYHIDAYRLEGKNIEKELKILGFEEIIKNPKNIVFIEWPEILGKNLPKKVIKIKISHLKNGGRKFAII